MMTKEIDIKNEAQVEKINRLACEAPYEVWLCDGTGTMMLDARSLLGLYALIGKRKREFPAAWTWKVRAAGKFFYLGPPEGRRGKSRFRPLFAHSVHKISASPAAESSPSVKPAQSPGGV